MPGSLAQRMRTDPPAYEARVWLSLLRPTVWWKQSLQPGGWQGYRGTRLRITASEAKNPLERVYEEDFARRVDRQRLTVVTTEPVTLREDLTELSFVRAERLAYLRRANTLCVVNRALGSFAEVRVDSRSVRICSVKVSLGGASIGVPKVSRGGQWVDWQPAWREGAELVMFGWQEEARFQRAWKVDRMEVKR
jgi:hypothetical protein